MEMIPKSMVYDASQHNVSACHVLGVPYPRLDKLRWMPFAHDLTDLANNALPGSNSLQLLC